MLVLTRRSQESVVVGRGGSDEPLLTVKVLEINGGKVRLGFDGDSEVPIHRLEVWERIRANRRPEIPSGNPAVQTEG